jgi:hypothetical protein
MKSSRFWAMASSSCLTFAICCSKNSFVRLFALVPAFACALMYMPASSAVTTCVARGLRPR